MSNVDALQHGGGPRDGLIRPILVGSTHPTPPHPPAARASSSLAAATVHTQSPTAPSTQALQEALGGAVVADGASVAELECALSVRAGSIVAPA